MSRLSEYIAELRARDPELAEEAIRRTKAFFEGFISKTPEDAEPPAIELSSPSATSDSSEGQPLQQTTALERSPIKLRLIPGGKSDSPKPSDEFPA